MADIKDDFHISGRLSCDRFNPPDSCIGNDAVDPDDPLDETKTAHRQVLLYLNGAGLVTTTATAERKIFHLAYQDGVITSVRIGVADAAVGDSTVTVDILKNGTTVLSAPITLTNADLDYTFQTAGLSTPGGVSFDEEDYLEASVTVSAGTGTLPKGVHAAVVVTETPTGA